MKNRILLQEIAKVFASENPEHLSLSNAIMRYKKMLVDLSEIDLDTKESASDIHFENGKAIGLKWAALCIDDINRTQKFIKGVIDAIKVLKTKQVKPIHLLYAGTGPFATLILPVLASYSEEDIQVTLIEINKKSIEYVKKVFDRLGFNGYIKEVINEDATKYKIKNDEKIDIILSETMQAALKEEQQVSIFFNLLRQIKNDVIVIPEKIVLELGLWNSDAKETAHDETNMKKLIDVFELSPQRIKTFEFDETNNQIKNQFPQIKVNLSKELLRKYDQLVIFTEIQIFEKNWIRKNESGLTIPLMLEDLSRTEYEELSITLRYKIDANPGIEYKRLFKFS